MIQNRTKPLPALTLLAGLWLGPAFGAAAVDDEQLDSLAAVRQAGVLRVALYQDNPPYSYLDKGRMQGLDVDIARALADKLGLGLSTMNLTASDESMSDDLRNAVWKGHYLGGGVADVMMHVPVDDEFAEENDQVTIFGPYFQEQLAVARNTDRIPQFDSLLVFAKEPVAVELETMSDMYLSSAEAGRLRNNTHRFRHVGQACQALLDGRVAAFMGTEAQLQDCVKGDGRFEITPIPIRRLFAWPVGMAVKADKPELTEALQKAMDQLQQEGGLESIFQRHGIQWRPPARG